jgi:hypothetical protein
MATSYPLPCPHCGKVIDSLDSMADTRADLDLHLLRHHPDLPDPTHDPRFRGIEGGSC